MSTIDTVKPRAMIKPIIIMAIAAAVVLGGVFGWQHVMAGFGKKFMAASASAPQTVSTTVAATAEWQREGADPAGRSRRWS